MRPSVQILGIHIKSWWHGGIRPAQQLEWRQQCGRQVSGACWACSLAERVRPRFCEKLVLYFKKIKQKATYVDLWPHVGVYVDLWPHMPQCYCSPQPQCIHHICTGENEQKYFETESNLPSLFLRSCRYRCTPLCLVHSFMFYKQSNFEYKTLLFTLKNLFNQEIVCVIPTALFAHCDSNV